jgi:PAS domain S-box-containing protein
MAEPQGVESPGLAGDASSRPAHLPLGLRLRLTVAIPLVVTFLVMLSGFLALWISYPLFFQSTRPTSVDDVERRVVTAFLAVGGFTVISLLAALALAASIARPLRALASKLEALRPAGELHQAPRAHTELAALGSALDGVVSSVSTLIRDSHTLHSLEGGVVTLDQSGIVTSLNTVAEAVLGAAAGEAVGRSIGQVIPGEAANEAFLRSVGAALAGGRRVSSGESTVRVRSGRTIQLGYSLSPLHDEKGRSLGVVLTFKDLAERKLAEQLLRRTENLAVLGTIAAGLAHEIRTPLSSIRGLVELIQEDAPPESPQRTYTGKILASIDRMDRLTRELLTISNPEPRTVEPVAPNQIARRTAELCRFDTDQKALTIQEDYASGLPSVQGDPDRLHQALLNLLRNAIEAANDGGTITLTTHGNGQGVAIAVHNTGSYIPPDQQEKLFAPFQTTKAKGTGLGLAIAHQIVRAHGGRITVASDPDQGTTFTVELPLVGPAAPGAQEEAREPAKHAKPRERGK